jgi:hypothetical protein
MYIILSPTELILTSFMNNLSQQMKKPNLPKVHPSAARLSLNIRPVTFRHLLTKVLALSGNSCLSILYVNKIIIK